MKGSGYAISPRGVALIKKWEGCARLRPDGRVQAYLCPGNVWTIGYGTTLGVKPGMVISKTEADTLFRRDLVKIEAAVNEEVRVPINQQMFDALVSFAYNVGIEAFEGSTLLRLLNRRDYAGAAGQFQRWNKSNGKVLRGLVDRRADEAALFLARP